MRIGAARGTTSAAPETARRSATRTVYTRGYGRAIVDTRQSLAYLKKIGANVLFGSGALNGTWYRLPST